MLLTFVSVLIVAAGAAYWLVARRARETDRAPPKPRAGGRFGAVEIRMRSSACAAAKALEGQRFLAKDAPALPLPSCDAAHCTCSFGKLSDRRTESRRLEHGGLSATLFLTNNRREQQDRRTDATERDERGHVDRAARAPRD